MVCVAIAIACSSTEDSLGSAKLVSRCAFAKEQGSNVNVKNKLGREGRTRECMYHEGQEAGKPLKECLCSLPGTCLGQSKSAHTFRHLVTILVIASCMVIGLAMTSLGTAISIEILLKDRRPSKVMGVITLLPINCRMTSRLACRLFTVGSYRFQSTSLHGGRFEIG
jgi:hypothetical protein